MKKTKINSRSYLNKIAGTEGKERGFSDDVILGLSKITDTHILVGKKEIEESKLVIKGE